MEFWNSAIACCLRKLSALAMSTILSSALSPSAKVSIEQPRWSHDRKITSDELYKMRRLQKGGTCALACFCVHELSMSTGLFSLSLHLYVLYAASFRITERMSSSTPGKSWLSLWHCVTSWHSRWCTRSLKKLRFFRQVSLSSLNSLFSWVSRKFCVSNSSIRVCMAIHLPDFTSFLLGTTDCNQIQS